MSRAVGRVAQPGDEAQVRAVFSGLQLVEVDGRITAQAASVAPRTLRSLDAIHLASALTVREELDSVVSYDGRLADAAAGIGAGESAEAEQRRSLPGLEPVVYRAERRQRIYHERYIG